MKKKKMLEKESTETITGVIDIISAWKKKKETRTLYLSFQTKHFIIKINLIKYFIRII